MTSLVIFEEFFLQLELGNKCFGLGLKTSSNALDLHCKDLIHPVAIERGQADLQTNWILSLEK
jgi:hypothetical protein